MTRLLSKDEIEDIIDFVKPEPDIPQTTAMSVVNAIKERFRKQLVEQKVYPATSAYFPCAFSALYC